MYNKAEIFIQMKKKNYLRTAFFKTGIIKTNACNSPMTVKGQTLLLAQYNVQIILPEL